jgi:glycosyltransferase involved in cell wall biosynthesis
MWKGFLVENRIPVFEIQPNRLKPYRLWRLYRIVAKHRPDIIVSWSLHAGAYVRMLAGVGRPVHVVAVRSDNAVDTSTGLPTTAKLLWGRRALEEADLLVSNSQWGISVLVENGLRLPPSAVIRNMVFAEGRALPGSPQACPRIAAAGTLNGRKSFDVLLRSLRQVADRGGRFELLLAGTGPDGNNLQRLAQDLGLSNSVRFLGHVADLPKLMSTCHLAVHPSKSEGLSNVVLEAMAEGLPVVATAVGGTPEMICDNRNGLLVVPDRPDDLAEAVLKLLRDANLRARLGSSALDWVRCWCSEDIITSEYERLFVRALRRPQ